MIFAALMAFVVILMVLIVFGVIVYTILDGVRASSYEDCSPDEFEEITEEDE